MKMVMIILNIIPTREDRAIVGGDFSPGSSELMAPVRTTP